MEKKEHSRESWGSNIGFLLAAVGSAVGLGNMWGFPYKMGTHGGFAFLLLYLLLLIFAGYVLVMTELALGRSTGQSVVLAYKKVRKEYAIIGWFGAIVPFLIMGFYCYLGGYCLKYTIANFGDIFGASWGVGGVDGPTYFSELMVDRGQSALFTILFCLIAIIIVSQGVSEGIERFNKIAMPALFFMLLIVIIRSVTLPGAGAGLAFLFKPNFEVFKGTGWISVLASAGGQLFFSLSVAMGIMVTYGSYLSKEEDLEKNSLIIAIADTTIAVMAGLAIFPAVFSQGQDPAGGVGLLYMTLQTVFNSMGGFGPIFGTIFYLLVAIAAMTSAMSILEAIIGSFIDMHMNAGKGNQRKKMAWIFGLLTMVEGVLVALDGLGTYFPPMFGRFCWVDGFDLMGEGVLMPIAAFATTIFFGWIDREVLPKEVEIGSQFKTEKFYRFCIRWIAPIFTLLVLLGQLDSFFGFGWF
ncbi:MAG: sodium-dependent transporter [Mogibacterium sp.]|nr:sodium-dependent transporter [Mogibacterium sp.]